MKGASYIALLLLLASCDAGEVGVFASIERASANETSNLPKITSPRAVVQINNKYYYTSMGPVYARGIDAHNWDVVRAPLGTESTTEGLASFNDRLYASFSIQRNSGTSKLYYVEEATIDGTNYARPQWNEVVTFGGEEIYGLYSAGSYLFVASTDPGSGSYKLHTLDMNHTVTTESNLLRITAVELHDSVYWFLSSGTLYYSGDPTSGITNASGTSNQPPDGKNYLGLSVLSATDPGLYVSTQNDIYLTTSSSSIVWTEPHSYLTDRSIVAFLETGGKAYALAEAQGIYEIFSAIPSNETHSNYPPTTQGLWKTLGTALFGSTVFVLTEENGLWSSDISNFPNNTWKNE